MIGTLQPRVVKHLRWCFNFSTLSVHSITWKNLKDWPHKKHPGNPLQKLTMASYGYQSSCGTTVVYDKPWLVNHSITIASFCKINVGEQWLHQRFGCLGRILGMGPNIVTTWLTSFAQEHISFPWCQLVFLVWYRGSTLISCCFRKAECWASALFWTWENGGTLLGKSKYSIDGLKPRRCRCHRSSFPHFRYIFPTIKSQ